MIWYVQGVGEVVPFNRRRPAIEFARQQVAEGRRAEIWVDWKSDGQGEPAHHAMDEAEGRGPHWPVHS